MVSHEEEQVQNATGYFEYRFEGGGLVTPQYKYVYLEEGPPPILPIFKGRDTQNGIRETGFTFRFDSYDFWGVNIPVGQGFRVDHYLVGGRTEVTSGSITGMINSSEKAGFFKFDLNVDVSGSTTRVEGFFILKQNVTAL
ncbi:hypothetical protein LVW35_04065 [Pseudomonas sp. HN11]|uniref:hypothetical protein n=1 Tax=Pseudomonas sp. HN11 TaxID=1344094 RepID=UPI001F22D254|nr:hypothetical protein [Pseudomonas sp. HN11]UII72357.1 hypothetical protein LVW35_04065 [Pseudomonas sp. HN11]